MKDKSKKKRPKKSKKKRPRKGKFGQKRVRGRGRPRRRHYRLSTDLSETEDTISYDGYFRVLSRDSTDSSSDSDVPPPMLDSSSDEEEATTRRCRYSCPWSDSEDSESEELFDSVSSETGEWLPFVNAATAIHYVAPPVQRKDSTGEGSTFNVFLGGANAQIQKSAETKKFGVFY